MQPDEKGLQYQLQL